MNRQLRVASLVLVLGLSLGLGYWQPQGWAAAQAGSGLKQTGNKLKQLFSPAGASKTFSPVPATPPAAALATITVTSTGDGAANAANCPHATNCRLRDAIAKAVASDTIDFSVTGTITLTSGELTISKNLTINGPGATQLTISGNQASRVFNISSGFTVALSGMTIANGNPSGAGGGILNQGALTLSSVVVTNNKAANGGGGIRSTSGSLTITNSTVSNNNCDAGNGFICVGGGIYGVGGALTLTGSTISGNTNNNPLGALQGAALDWANGTATLTNCTISGHSGSNNNDIITNQTNSASGGTLTLTNCTVTANYSKSLGPIATAGSSGFSATTQLRNTLVAGNSGRPNFGNLGSATIISLGNNLDSDGSSGFTNGVNGDIAGTGNSPVNALLAPLANYGGSTNTHALLPGSPALNVGNNCVLTNNCASHNLGFNLTTDQRGAGFNRQVGSAVDIGAFESRGFTLTLAATNSGNNQSTNINTNFANPLRVTVVATGMGEPVAGGRVTFTPPASSASATIAGNPAAFDGSGAASSGIVTANGMTGSYSVQAGGPGLNAVSFNLTNFNTAPTITALNQSRQQGNQPTNVQIATVLDAEDAENNLTVTVNGLLSATTNGVTINNLTVNAAGQVRADLSVTCTATNASFTLTVTDSLGATANATLNVTVPANTAPTVGNYPNSTVVTGGTLTITPDVPPTDNTTVASVTATATPNSFTGIFSGNTSSGGVTVTNANPAGSYTITVTLTDNCGATTTRSFMLMVSACGAVLSKQRELFEANSGSGSFTVTIDAVCSWTAVSDNPDWITVTAPMGGFAGSGTVSYSVANNPNNTRRTGSLTVAGQTFRVFQGAQFGDVPTTHPFYTEIGKLSALGITLGCGGGNYCPDANTTREQMAIFIERGLGVFNPPVPTQQTFQDVPPTLVGYMFIEDFVARGITAGCAAGPPRLYCPSASVTREQMAIFILRGLGVFTPPAGPQTPTFADVPNSGATDASHEFIEEFARRGITSGCAAGPPRLYCPTSPVTRGQMAVFLLRAFGL
jgi:hypothetical protein